MDAIKNEGQADPAKPAPAGASAPVGGAKWRVGDEVRVKPAFGAFVGKVAQVSQRRDGMIVYEVEHRGSGILVRRATYLESQLEAVNAKRRTGGRS